VTRRRFGRFALAAAVVVVLVAGLLLAAVSARSSDRGQRPVLVMLWNFRVVTMPASDLVPVCRESWGPVLVTSARHGGEHWAAVEELRAKGVGFGYITRCSRP
jgi:hypothetical protein